MVIKRKPLHVNINEDVHAAFRKICIDNKLTMQEVCEYFVTGLVDERPTMLKVMQEISRKKKAREKKVTKIEADSIYQAIGGE
jgi:hypothetical protein